MGIALVRAIMLIACTIRLAENAGYLEDYNKLDSGIRLRVCKDIVDGSFTHDRHMSGRYSRRSSRNGVVEDFQMSTTLMGMQEVLLQIRQEHREATARFEQKLEGLAHQIDVL